NSNCKGIDRMNGKQFSLHAKEMLDVTSHKCINGNFRFSPFLETLKSKGRDKFPRVIAIPTIRDRIVLNQLNKIISTIFVDCVPRNIANSYIRKLVSELPQLLESDT